MKTKNVEKLYIEPYTYIRRRSWKEEEQVSHWDIRAGGRLGEREWAGEGERCSTLPTQGRCFERRRLRSSAPHRGPGYSPYTVRHSPPSFSPRPAPPRPLSPFLSPLKNCENSRAEFVEKKRTGRRRSSVSLDPPHNSLRAAKSMASVCVMQWASGAGRRRECGLWGPPLALPRDKNPTRFSVRRASERATIHSSIHGWNDTHRWMEYYTCYGWNDTYEWMEYCTCNGWNVLLVMDG